MALDSTARTALETVLPHFKDEATAGLAGVTAGGGKNSSSASTSVPKGLMGDLHLIGAAVENAAVSSEQVIHAGGVGLVHHICLTLLALFTS